MALLADLQEFLEGAWNALQVDPFFQVSFLLVAALGSSLLFRRFGQPKVIGEILVGILIGPSVLGIVSIEATLDPTAPNLDPVSLLAILGSIILLFMIGLECDFREIYTLRSLGIGLGGVLLPWGAGYLLADLLGYGFGEAVFVGAALTATSVAITSVALRELGLLGGPVASAILGAAVVDDILAFIVLSVSTGLVAGTVDVAALGAIIASAAGFILIGFYAGLRGINRLFRWLAAEGHRQGLRQGAFVLALSIAFVYSAVAELLGISAIVGAFLAGTIFATSIFREELQRGATYFEAVFAPIFFVALGVVVDLQGIGDLIVFGLLLTLVAIATKVAGCGLPALLAGFDRKESLAIGIGMMPRLEVALIIAFIALDAGIIERDLYSAVVFMGVLTALLAPPLLRRALRPIPID